MHDRLMEIYYAMYNHFGPRHWWPADTTFEVIVGAILTQSVAWRNVEKAIQNIKDNNALDLKILSCADLEQLAQWIRSTRYYNMKAKKLQAFCQYVVTKYDGSLEKLFEKPLWDLRKELLGIYGIGEETADSIVLYAAQKPIFVVDVYTRRIFSRLGIFSPDISYGEMQGFFMEHLPSDVGLYNEYHALIDGVGNRYCGNKKPKCHRCPLLSFCPKGNNIVEGN